jgi:coenzyme F420-0:L-glutamate ligase
MGQQRIEAAAIQTGIFPPNGDLLAFLLEHVKPVAREGAVLAITSKIVSLAEGRIVPAGSISKRELVKREADVYLGDAGYGVELTIKHGLISASAGIDESNSGTGDFILFPENPYASAARIGQALRQALGIQRFGVIITDSHTTPLRRGVTGVSLAHWGIRATRSLGGPPDIFARPLKFTHVNVVDALATMAVFVMGEADDRCPLALVSGARVEFTSEGRAEEIVIEPAQDIYYPLLTGLRGK